MDELRDVYGDAYGTVVLSEIEVRRARQGKAGRTVHDAFLSQRSEERARLPATRKPLHPRVV